MLMVRLSFPPAADLLPSFSWVRDSGGYPFTSRQRVLADVQPPNADRALAKYTVRRGTPGAQSES